MHAAAEDPAGEGAEQRCGEHRGRGLETPRVCRVSQSLKELGVSERGEWNLLLPALFPSLLLTPNNFSGSIKAFAVPEGFSSASAAQDSKSEDREQVYHPPEIIPLYGVSTKMIPLFQESGHR